MKYFISRFTVFQITFGTMKQGRHYLSLFTPYIHLWTKQKSMMMIIIKKMKGKGEKKKIRKAFHSTREHQSLLGKVWLQFCLLFNAKILVELD